MKTLILVVMLMAVSAAHAESRDPSSARTPQQLEELSTLVFEGTVTGIETNMEIVSRVEG